MKRILIVSHGMELGGAERSLIGLLDALDPGRCRVDLFLLRREGELLADIPQYVRLLPEIPAYTVLARPMKDTLREGHVLLTAARLAGKLAARLYENAAPAGRAAFPWSTATSSPALFAPNSAGYGV